MKIPDLGGMGKPARAAVALAPAVLYAAILTLVLLVPERKKIRALTGEISAQQNEIADTRSVAARLDLLKDENAGLKARLAELDEQLPVESEISPLLRKVSDEGTRAGLQIISWKPGPRKLHPSKVVYEVPVNVVLSGGYNDFGRFLGALTGLKRIVNISDIKMGSPQPDGDKAILSISFTALTFTDAEPGGLAN